MFKPGSIRKIEVTNFVTYTHAELFPGPNLNMIIGPNGTGKSTMVAAIILGLGGNPKTVGRGKKVSEYVKHNCELATIKIYLQDEGENKFVCITREFDLHNKNVWEINGEKLKENQVIEYLSRFNIQVDNLCQFLPQDRVQDFSKLNKQELLRQTQIALCRHDLIEKHESLIKRREKHKELLNSISKQEKLVFELKETNASMEGKVTNFNKKKKYIEHLQHIDRRIAWVMYDEVRMKVQDIKTDKTKATDSYERQKKAIEPMETEIAKGKEAVQIQQNKNAKQGQLLRNMENSIKGNNENMNTLRDSLRRIDDDTNVKLNEIQYRQKEIDASKIKLAELKELYVGCNSKMTEEDVKKRQMTSEIQKLMVAKEKSEDEKEQRLESKRNIGNEVRALEHELSRFQNVKEQRLMRLQRIDLDAYRGALWLKDNKHLFKGEVFGPIMLELNVFDQKDAVYVENIIPTRDRIAFTCVEKSDMNLLINYLRVQQRLKVNVVHSGDTGEPINQIQPNIPLEHITKYGFYTYVHSLFTAPEPILRYLYKTYKVHNIPVGNKKTDEHFNDIPSGIRQFFSDTFKYSISVSKYSKEKSVRQNNIRSDGGLSISLDVVKIEKLKSHLEEVRKRYASFDEDIEKCSSKIKICDDGIASLKEKLREIGETKQQAAILGNKIKALGSKIVDIERNMMSEDQVLAEAKTRREKIVSKIVAIQEVLKNDLKKFSELNIQRNLGSLTEDILRQKIIFLENKIEENRVLLKKAEEMMNRIKEQYANVMSEAKMVLNKAKSLSNGFTPNDEGFEEFREVFEGLSDDLQSLKSEKEQIQVKINCLNTADDGEMEAYAEREQQAEDLEGKIEKAKSDLTKITTHIKRVQNEWLVPLNELLSEINQKFSSAFEKMGCAGEIDLYKGVDENDFSEYGISIKVTYRNDMPLQELNRTVQSGGERAVATATYMLSLQELTPVPFRCVDEINQGMDANNERRMFELLVESTSQPNTAQYFLITPKLIPNLKFSKTMMVHVVHNGPCVVQDKKWSFTSLCNPLGTMIG